MACHGRRKLKYVLTSGKLLLAQHGRRKLKYVLTTEKFVFGTLWNEKTEMCFNNRKVAREERQGRPKDVAG